MFVPVPRGRVLGCPRGDITYGNDIIIISSHMHIPKLTHGEVKPRRGRLKLYDQHNACLTDNPGKPFP